ncbi:MAG: signal peptidase I [Candidatus Omnitrophica bacterium]|nr:signal peptidase I [Candidatus Omnitrophota bacterium]
MKKIFSFLAIVFLLVITAVFVFSDYLSGNFTSYKIPLDSMAPTISTNDLIAVATGAYEKTLPMRGDIIVFITPFDEKKKFAKRIVGLPGDKVEIKEGKVYVNGKRIQSDRFPDNRYYLTHGDWDYGNEGQIIDVPDNMYYVLGDKSAHSSDSRQWGFVPAKNVIGKATVVYWPPWRWKFIK